MISNIRYFSLAFLMWRASFETLLFVLKGQSVDWPYEALLVNVDFQSMKISSLFLSPQSVFVMFVASFPSS